MAVRAHAPEALDSPTMRLTVAQPRSTRTFSIACVTAAILFACGEGHAESASGQIRGTVSYARRAPAVGAVVVLTRADERSLVKAASTGTNGTFAFDGLADGIYNVEVRREGYVPVIRAAITVRAPFRAIVEVHLAPGAAEPDAATPAGNGRASLTATVRVARRGALAEARVRLVRSDGVDDPRVGLTSEAGTIAFEDLAAGRWRLEVVAAGFLPLRTGIDLEGGVDVEATLEPQPADYQPLPQDLIAPEDVSPPPGGTRAVISPPVSPGP